MPARRGARGRSAVVPSTLPLSAETLLAAVGGPDDHLGEVLAGAADLDGDGTSDLAISARGRSPGLAVAGSVFVISGKELWK